PNRLFRGRSGAAGWSKSVLESKGGSFRQRGDVRPLLLTSLLVIASAATFLGIAALGTLGLNQPLATVTTAPSQAQVDPQSSGTSRPQPLRRGGTASSSPSPARPARAAASSSRSATTRSPARPDPPAARTSTARPRSAPSASAPATPASPCEPTDESAAP